MSEQPKTLEQIKEKLRQPKTHYKELPHFDHSILGRCYIKKISSKAYCDLEVFEHGTSETQKWPEAHRHKWASQGRLRTFLMEAVVLESGERLDTETAQALIESEECGADNHQLMLMCEEQNPPRSYLVGEVQALLVSNTYFAQILDVLLRFGGFETLVNLLALDEDDDEHQKAREDLAKLMDAAPGILALLNVREIEKAEKQKEQSKEIGEAVSESVVKALV